MDKNILHLDIETFSSVDIKVSGMFKYAESRDFEIILLSWAVNDGEIQTINPTIESMPDDLEDMLFDENYIKVAHNAMFERTCLRRIGYNIPIDQWHCTAVHSAYCGLPLKLDTVGKILDIENKKLDSGTLLIKYFCSPCKPTASNGYRTRNFYFHDTAKWNRFIEYNVVDVAAERDIYNKLKAYPIPDLEMKVYQIDQMINDRGILVDIELVKNAIELDTLNMTESETELKQITNLDNPNSLQQLKSWITLETGLTVNSLTADSIPMLISSYGDKFPKLKKVLEIRQNTSKSSIKKYYTMINCLNNDGRIRGLFQHYGARTGRWTGRLVQLQNLKKNKGDVDIAVDLVKKRDYDTIKMCYNVSDILSQLIRPSFIATGDGILHIADYKAIEARVLAWLADETWKIDVFNTHGKIYEALASRMFDINFEDVTKESDERAKAKNAELALGYEGGVEALKRAYGDKNRPDDTELKSQVNLWRKANPNTVRMWHSLNKSALRAVTLKQKVETGYKGIIFDCDDFAFTMQLPSGRKLFYKNARIGTNSFGTSQGVKYDGVIQKTNQWGTLDTYGGKITENLVQAISRDVIANALVNLHEDGFNTVIHVHDEIGCDNLEDGYHTIERMSEIMSEDIEWAEGLNLGVDGFSSKFFKKD